MKFTQKVFYLCFIIMSEVIGSYNIADIFPSAISELCNRASASYDVVYSYFLNREENISETPEGFQIISKPYVTKLVLEEKRFSGEVDKVDEFQVITHEYVNRLMSEEAEVSVLQHVQRKIDNVYNTVNQNNASKSLIVIRDVMEALSVPIGIIAIYNPQTGAVNTILVICGLTKNLKPILDRLERYLNSKLYVSSVNKVINPPILFKSDQDRKH